VQMDEWIHNQGQKLGKKLVLKIPRIRLRGKKRK